MYDRMLMDPATHLIPQALERLLRTQPLSPGKVGFAWRVAVGQAIERATTVALGTDGMLQVRTADPRWESEVRRLSPVILARLQHLLGTDVVRELHVQRSATPQRGGVRPRLGGPRRS